MTKAWAILIILLIIVGGVWLSMTKITKPKTTTLVKIDMNKDKKPMQILSPEFKPGEKIPIKYTCQGENINPPLNIENLNTNTKSLAIIIDDLDAPKGDWVHLVMWNINPETTSISENSVPKSAVVGVNDFGQNNYGGPCPPSGTHRYFFKVFALDSKLTITSFSTKPELLKAMEGHILESAEMFGIFSKE